MAQSLSKIILHIVFSTKQRTPWLRDGKLRGELYAYMAAILRNMNCPAIIINGTADDVHLLCLLSRKLPVMDVVKQAKTETSKWTKKRSETLGGFAWQAGYGAFSVSESNVEQVRRYIEDQDEHHRRRSFQEEFRELYRRHGVELDERYAWE